MKAETDALDAKIVNDNVSNPDLMFRLKTAFGQLKGQLAGKPRRAGEATFVPVLAFPEGELANLSKVMVKPIQEYMDPDTNPMNGALLSSTDVESPSTTKTKTKVKNKKH